MSRLATVNGVRPTSCRRGRTPRFRARSRLAGNAFAAVCQRMPRHHVAERQAAPSAICRATLRAPCWRRACAASSRGRATGPLPRKRSASQPRSTAPRRECRSSRPWPSFVILAKPPAMVTRGTGMRRRYFSMPPTKSPMSISAIFGQAVELLHGRLGGRAGRAGDVVEARGAGDVDAAMDRVDPGRAGIGHDDAGGAEDRQAADDAEPRR